MAQDQTWLESDKEIPGQKYVCLSFLSPEKVLANKDVFFFNRFLENYEVEYKVSASEKFLMDQILQVTKAVTKVEDLLANSGFEEAKKALSASDLSGAPVVDVSGSAVPDAEKAAKQWRDDSLKILQEVRANLSKNAADDLAVYVKQNMRDFKESSIQETYENYMFKNRKKLEEEFFTKNEFRTSIRGLKVRGVYDTAAEAGARAKTLQKLDPYFNVYVGQMGFWLPWDPEPSEVADQEYAEDQLNTLMKNYKQNESQKEVLYEEQKRERMAGSKVAVPKFGPGSKDENVMPSDMFGGGGEADLAIARKKELAAAKVTLNV
jgi:sulfur carrier protein ThiS